MKKQMNRIAGVLLALALCLSLTPAANAKGVTDFTNDEAYLRTSYDEDNYLEFRIDGATLTVGGKLILDGLNGVWVKFDGENSDYNSYRRSSAEVSSGQAFTVRKSLTGISEPTSVSVYTRRKGQNSYWSLVWDRIYVEKAADGWRIMPSAVLENNRSLAERWVNPADCFDTEAPDGIQKMSDQIVGSTTDDYEKIFLLNRWVAENIYYDYDSYYADSGTTYAAADVLLSRRSVCEGYANLLRALIRAQGIPATKVTTYALGVSTRGGSFAVDTQHSDTREDNHAYVEAFVDGRWVAMDATWDSNNRYQNGVYEAKAPNGYYYFDITPEALALDHKLITRGGFGDTPSEWAQSEAKLALSAGLIPYELQSGYQTDITREAFCRLIVNMLRVREGADDNATLMRHFGLSRRGLAPTVENVFSDTSDEDVFTAYQLGIVTGVSKEHFDPDRGITRQEAALMLQRVAKVLELTPKGARKRFTDLNTAASWARDGIRFVSALVSQDGSPVMGGTGKGFSPLAGYTVEQSILTAYRLFRC